MALPPLNNFLADNLIKQTRTSKSLMAHRNLGAIDMNELQQVLIRVSEMVCQLPQIEEMDINPLVADENGVMALDCRIMVAHRAPSLDPYDHMAIHPPQLRPFADFLLFGQQCFGSIPPISAGPYPA